MTASQELKAKIARELHHFTSRESDHITDDFESVIRALDGVNDLVGSTHDLHLVDPENLNSLLGLIRDRFSELNDKLELEGYVPAAQRPKTA